MSIEPVKLARNNFVYKPNTAIPVDLSQVFLPGATWVTVRVFFQTMAGAPKWPVRNPASGYPPGDLIWRQGFLVHLKAALFTANPVSFIPPTPGIYTVELDPIGPAGVDHWESPPITVVP